MPQPACRAARGGSRQEGWGIGGTTAGAKARARFGSDTCNALRLPATSTREPAHPSRPTYLVRSANSTSPAQRPANRFGVAISSAYEGRSAQRRQIELLEISTAKRRAHGVLGRGASSQFKGNPGHTPGSHAPPPRPEWMRPGPPAIIQDSRSENAGVETTSHHSTAWPASAPLACASGWRWRGL